MNEMIERYYEFQRLLTHPEYTLDETEYNEYTELCQELLYQLMVKNSDVFERLKNR